MQYILTEDEFNSLISRKRYEAEKKKVESLNRKVLELSKFDCVREKPRLMAYCDNCPVADTCIQPKNFSK